MQAIFQFRICNYFIISKLNNKIYKTTHHMGVNLVSHSRGRPKIEGTWKQSSEENILA
jgi:hypothetical protein